MKIGKFPTARNEIRVVFVASVSSKYFHQQSFEKSDKIWRSEKHKREEENIRQIDGIKCAMVFYF